MANDDGIYNDAVLVALYRTMIENGGEFGVSLLLGGSWVTGMAISGRSWFEQLALVVDQAERGGGLGEAFRTIGREVYPALSEIEAGVVEPGHSNESRTLNFLHLRDASLFTSGGIRQPNPGSLLRVRFCDIGAWMLGNIGPADYVPPPAPI